MVTNKAECPDCGAVLDPETCIQEPEWTELNFFECPECEEGLILTMNENTGEVIVRSETERKFNNEC